MSFSYSKNSWKLLYLHQPDPHNFQIYFDIVFPQSQCYDYLGHVHMYWDYRLHDDPLQEVPEVTRFFFIRFCFPWILIFRTDRSHMLLELKSINRYTLWCVYSRYMRFSQSFMVSKCNWQFTC